MRKFASKFITWSLPVFACAFAAQGGTFIDNFSVSHDYLNGGVPGTLWDGVTLGTKTPGPVYGWDANTTAANTLTITNQGGGWGGDGDGPFLWKTVSGDFTNTVKVSGFLPFKGYNSAGLLVRDPAPASGENMFYLGEFGHPEWGVALLGKNGTNGVSEDFGSATESYTNMPVWIQITRVGTVLTANASTDGTTWDTIYTVDRPDLPAAVEVGIYNSNYDVQDTYAQYQSFTLVGPNVNSAATPPAAATGLVLTPGLGTITVSWTAGVGSDSSTVVMRRAGPITRQPLNGTSYTGNSTFGSGSDLGETNTIVYAGSGSTVVVTNLDAATLYTVAVYAQAGSGASLVYATNPPVVTGTTYDPLVAISISYGATNAVAVDDTIKPTVIGHYSSGAVLPVAAGYTLDTSDANTASLLNTTTLYGSQAGAVTITATYASFSATSNLIVVKLPATDDFSTPWNYVAQGIAGTPWNGVTLGGWDIPPLGSWGGTAGTTFFADAGITKAGRLTVKSTQTGYDESEDDGFFLYRLQNGDFSISVQLTSMDPQPYHMPGLMVRLPFEVTSSENTLAIVTFNEYGIGNFVRSIENGTKTETAQQSSPAMPFLKIERVGDSFMCYQKAHALDSWTLIHSNTLVAFSGQPAQVGIVQGIYTGNSAVAEFDNLTITGASPSGAPSPATGLALTRSATDKVTASWTAGAGSSGSIVILHPWMPITRQPAEGANYSSSASPDFSVATSDIGGTNVVVYAGSGTSVVVSNLPPAYYNFSVYAYATVSGTNRYSLVNPPTRGIDLFDLAAQYVGGNLQVSWSAGTLLESTNVTGPWTTNLNTSPYIVPTPGGNMFYRVQIR